MPKTPKQDIPLRNRFLISGALKYLIGAALLLLPILSLVAASIFMLIEGTHSFGVGEVFILVVLACYCAFFYKTPLMDFLAGSYERRQGVIVDVFTLRHPSVFRPDQHMIELESDGDGVQYKTPGRANRPDPEVGDVILTKNSEVEIFYGRRSKTIVMATVIAKNENKAKRSITDLFGPL